MEQINYITREPYTKGNIDILVNAQGKYPTGEWLTFLQAKEVGRKICKGEKGTRIVRVFVTGEITPQSGKDKKAVRHYTLFNLAQTELIEK